MKKIYTVGLFEAKLKDRIRKKLTNIELKLIKFK